MRGGAGDGGEIDEAGNEVMAILHAHRILVVVFVDIALVFGGTCIFYAMYRWQESIWRRERPTASRGFPVKLQEKAASDIPPQTNPKS